MKTGLIFKLQNNDRQEAHAPTLAIAGHHVSFIDFLFAIGPDSYRDSGLKIIYRAIKKSMIRKLQLKMAR